MLVFKCQIVKAPNYLQDILKQLPERRSCLRSHNIDYGLVIAAEKLFLQDHLLFKVQSAGTVYHTI